MDFRTVKSLSIGGRPVSRLEIGGRTVWTRPSPWTNPYVTDGLVAMWDAEWNVGGGIHDGSSTRWVDCVGGRVLNAIGNSSFGDKVATTTATPCGWIGDGEVNGVAFAEVLMQPRNPDGDAPTYFEADGMLSWGERSGSYWKHVIGFKNGLQATHIRTQAPRLYSYSQVYTNAYHNGSPYESATIGTGDIIDGYGATSIFCTPDHDFDCIGDIYCLRLYSRELAASEVAANYAVDKSRFGLS